MKKFKIIETSRFLSTEEFANVKGGGRVVSTVCTSLEAHSSCIMGIWMYCGPDLGLSGYSNDACGSDVLYNFTCIGLQFGAYCPVGVSYGG